MVGYGQFSEEFDPHCKSVISVFILDVVHGLSLLAEEWKIVHRVFFLGVHLAVIIKISKKSTVMPVTAIAAMILNS